MEPKPNGEPNKNDNPPENPDGGPPPNPTTKKTISATTRLPVNKYPGKSLTAGNLANQIVNTFCYSIGFCLVFTAVVQVFDFVIYLKTIDIVSANINRQYSENESKSDEKIIAFNKELIASNTEAIKTIEKINEKDLTNAWELFKNFGAIMAGPLGFVLGFYFRESSGD